MSDNSNSRRRFLGLSLSSGLAAASAGALTIPSRNSLAIDPIARSGNPRFSLSLAAYSFRTFFAFSRDKKQSPPGGGEPIDMFTFIDYCADLGIPAAELTSYFFPPDADGTYFREVRRHAFLRGIVVSGTAVGNNFAHPAGAKREAEIAYTKNWIDKAAAMGAPHVRVFAGASDAIPRDESVRLCVEALRECCDYAGQRGIVLGLENHGGIVAEADGLLEIIDAVDSPWFGVNLDTGNFHTADPYGDLAKCAPFAVNVQVKVEMRAAGKKESTPTDFTRIAKILKDARYQGFVALEYEANEDPYDAVPRYLDELRMALSN